MINKILITFIFLLSFYFVAFSQGSGTYIIPPGSPYTATTVDSILTLHEDSSRVEFYINQDSLGKIMWFSEPNNYKAATKHKSISYVLTEYHWVRLESQFDSLTWSIDFGIKTVSEDSTGSNLWSELVNLTVIDSTELVINSNVNLDAKIYKAKDYYNPVAIPLSIIGNGINQHFSVNLENGILYVIVFIKDTTNIVNIKKFRG